MKDLIAKKQVGRVAIGRPFRARAHEARALVALGMADYAPKRTLSLPRKGSYQRRDMVAAAPSPAIAWPNLPMVAKDDDGQA